MPTYGGEEQSVANGFSGADLQPKDQTILDRTEHPELIPVIADEMRTGWTPDTVFALWGVTYPALLFLALVFGAGIAYCALRIVQIRRAEWASYRKVAHTVSAEDVPATHLRWRRIMEHAESDDEHKWRLAILECDIMLNELLDLQGYKGETMAEKMKMANRSQFNTIDSAWEAHKVRNRVAHESADTPLTEREKDHTIALYRRVFEEFGFI